jgi:hypothetical protein
LVEFCCHILVMLCYAVLPAVWALLLGLRVPTWCAPLAPCAQSCPFLPQPGTRLNIERNILEAQVRRSSLLGATRTGSPDGVDSSPENLHFGSMVDESPRLATLAHPTLTICDHRVAGGSEGGASWGHDGRAHTRHPQAWWPPCSMLPCRRSRYHAACLHAGTDDVPSTSSVIFG